MKVRIPNNGNQMADMLRKMQEDMAAKQEELDASVYEVAAGGGAVNVKITGKREVLSIDISEELIDPDDVETLQDILVAAVNEAIRKVDDTTSSEMEKITSQMPMLPGGMGFPGL